MTQAAAGWYDQPDGTKRYWDGSQWTEHVTPAAPPVPPPPPVAAPPAPPVPPAPVAAPEPVAVPVPPPAPEIPAAIAPPTPQVIPAPVYSVPPPAAQAFPVKKKKKVWPWIVGIIGALVVLGIVAVVLFVTVLVKATQGPRDTIDSFDKAWETADCDLLDSVTTSNYQDETGFGDCAVFQDSANTYGGAQSLKVISTDVVNSTATVVTHEVYDGDSAEYELTYTLVKDGSHWKIDHIDVASE